METFAERFRQARTDAGLRGLSEFHRALTGRGGEISYEAVRNYASGFRSPPLQFVWDASGVLGVSPAWLAFGADAVAAGAADAVRLLSDAEAAIRAARLSLVAESDARP